MAETISSFTRNSYLAIEKFANSVDVRSELRSRGLELSGGHKPIPQSDTKEVNNNDKSEAGHEQSEKEIQSYAKKLKESKGDLKIIREAIVNFHRLGYSEVKVAEMINQVNQNQPYAQIQYWSDEVTQSTLIKRFSQHRKLIKSLLWLLLPVVCYFLPYPGATALLLLIYHDAMHRYQAGFYFLTYFLGDFWNNRMEDIQNFLVKKYHEPDFNFEGDLWLNPVDRAHDQLFEAKRQFWKSVLESMSGVYMVSSILVFPWLFSALRMLISAPMVLVQTGVFSFLGAISIGFFGLVPLRGPHFQVTAADLGLEHAVDVERTSVTGLRWPQFSNKQNAMIEAARFYWNRNPMVLYVEKNRESKFEWNRQIRRDTASRLLARHFLTVVLFVTTALSTILLIAISIILGSGVIGAVEFVIQKFGQSFITNVLLIVGSCCFFPLVAVIIISAIVVGSEQSIAGAWQKARADIKSLKKNVFLNPNQSDEKFWKNLIKQLKRISKEEAPFSDISFPESIERLIRDLSSLKEDHSELIPLHEALATGKEGTEYQIKGQAALTSDRHSDDPSTKVRAELRTTNERLIWKAIAQFGIPEFYQEQAYLFLSGLLEINQSQWGTPFEDAISRLSQVQVEQIKSSISFEPIVMSTTSLVRRTVRFSVYMAGVIVLAYAAGAALARDINLFKLFSQIGKQKLPGPEQIDIGFAAIFLFTMFIGLPFVITRFQRWLDAKIKPYPISYDLRRTILNELFVKQGLMSTDDAEELTRRKYRSELRTEWADQIKSLLLKDFPFLELDFSENGYLFRAIRSGLRDGLSRGSFSYLNDGGVAAGWQEKHLVYFVSEDPNDALDVAEFQNGFPDNAVVIFPSKLFHDEMNAGRAAIMTTHGLSGTLTGIKWPLMTNPVTIQDSAFIIVTPETKQYLDNLLVNGQASGEEEKLRLRLLEYQKQGIYQKIVALNFEPKGMAADAIQEKFKAFLLSKSIQPAQAIDSEIYPNLAEIQSDGVNKRRSELRSREFVKFSELGSAIADYIDLFRKRNGRFSPSVLRAVADLDFGTERQFVNVASVPLRNGFVPDPQAFGRAVVEGIVRELPFEVRPIEKFSFAYKKHAFRIRMETGNQQTQNKEAHSELRARKVRNDTSETKLHPRADRFHSLRSLKRFFLGLLIIGLAASMFIWTHDHDRLSLDPSFIKVAVHSGILAIVSTYIFWWMKRYLTTGFLLREKIYKLSRSSPTYEFEFGNVRNKLLILETPDGGKHQLYLDANRNIRIMSFRESGQGLVKFLLPYALSIRPDKQLLIYKNNIALQVIGPQKIRIKLLSRSSTVPIIRESRLNKIQRIMIMHPIIIGVALGYVMMLHRFMYLFAHAFASQIIGGHVNCIQCIEEFEFVVNTWTDYLLYGIPIGYPVASVILKLIFFGYKKYMRASRAFIAPTQELPDKPVLFDETFAKNSGQQFVLSVRPFKERQVGRVIRKLKTIRESGLQVSDQTIQNLYRLVRTVQSDPFEGPDIEFELMHWLETSADLKAIAAIVTGWFQIRGDHTTKINRILEQRFKLNKKQIEKLKYLSESYSIPLEETAIDPPSSMEPIPYTDQLKDRTIYQIFGQEFMDEALERIDSIDANKLKDWVQTVFNKNFSSDSKVPIRSIFLYGSYIYGSIDEPRDLDLIAVVEGDSLEKPIPDERTIPKNVFRSMRGRSVNSANIYFLTRKQLQTSKRAIHAASVGILLKAKNLYDEPLNSIRNSDQKQLFYAASELSDAFDFIKKAGKVNKMIDSARIFNWKGFRRLMEVVLYINAIDLSLSIPISEIVTMNNRMEDYIVNKTKGRKITEGLKRLYRMVRTAVLLTRVSLVWRQMEEWGGGEHAKQAQRSELRRKIETGTDKLLAEVDRGVATVIFNDLPNRNAMNGEMFEAVPRVLFKLDNDPDVKLLVLRGAEDPKTHEHHLAGGNIEERYQIMDRGDHKELEKQILEKYEMLAAIHYFSKPKIALIDGFAVGGGLAAAFGSHYVLATEKAKFGTPETKTVGSYMDGANAAFMADRFGLDYVANELFITGRHEEASALIDQFDHQVPQLGDMYAAYYGYTGSPIPLDEAIYYGLVHSTIQDAKATEETLKELVSSQPNLSPGELLNKVNDTFPRSQLTETERQAVKKRRDLMAKYFQVEEARFSGVINFMIDRLSNETLRSKMDPDELQFVIDTLTKISKNSPFGVLATSHMIRDHAFLHGHFIPVSLSQIYEQAFARTLERMKTSELVNGKFPFVRMGMLLRSTHDSVLLRGVFIREIDTTLKVFGIDEEFRNSLARADVLEGLRSFLERRKPDWPSKQHDGDLSKLWGRIEETLKKVEGHRSELRREAIIDDALGGAFGGREGIGKLIQRWQIEKALLVFPFYLASLARSWLGNKAIAVTMSSPIVATKPIFQVNEKSLNNRVANPAVPIYWANVMLDLAMNSVFSRLAFFITVTYSSPHVNLGFLSRQHPIINIILSQYLFYLYKIFERSQQDQKKAEYEAAGQVNRSGLRVPDWLLYFGFGILAVLVVGIASLFYYTIRHPDGDSNESSSPETSGSAQDQNDHLGPPRSELRKFDESNNAPRSRIRWILNSIWNAQGGNLDREVWQPSLAHARRLIKRFRRVPGMGEIILELGKNFRNHKAFDAVLAELFAAEYLEKHVPGSKVIGLRMKARHGEIDIVLRIGPVTSQGKPKAGAVKLAPGIYLAEVKYGYGNDPQLVQWKQAKLKTQLKSYSSVASILTQAGLDVQGLILVSAESPAYVASNLRRRAYWRASNVSKGFSLKNLLIAFDPLSYPDKRQIVPPQNIDVRRWASVTSTPAAVFKKPIPESANLALSRPLRPRKKTAPDAGDPNRSARLPRNFLETVAQLKEALNDHGLKKEAIEAVLSSLASQAHGFKIEGLALKENDGLHYVRGLREEIRSGNPFWMVRLHRANREKFESTLIARWKIPDEAVQDWKAANRSELRTDLRIVRLLDERNDKLVPAAILYMDLFLTFREHGAELQNLTSHDLFGITPHRHPEEGMAYKIMFTLPNQLPKAVLEIVSDDKGEKYNAQDSDYPVFFKFDSNMNLIAVYITLDSEKPEYLELEILQRAEKGTLKPYFINEEIGIQYRSGNLILLPQPKSFRLSAPNLVLRASRTTEIRSELRLVRQAASSKPQAQEFEMLDMQDSKAPEVKSELRKIAEQMNLIVPKPTAEMDAAFQKFAGIESSDQAAQTQILGILPNLGRSELRSAIIQSQSRQRKIIVFVGTKSEKQMVEDFVSSQKIPAGRVVVTQVVDPNIIFGDQKRAELRLVGFAGDEPYAFQVTRLLRGYDVKTRIGTEQMFASIFQITDTLRSELRQRMAALIAA